MYINGIEFNTILFISLFIIKNLMLVSRALTTKICQPYWQCFLHETFTKFWLPGCYKKTNVQHSWFPHHIARMHRRQKWSYLCGVKCRMWTLTLGFKGVEILTKGLARALLLKNAEVAVFLDLSLFLFLLPNSHYDLDNAQAK